MIQNLTESRIYILLQKVSDSSFFLFEPNYLSAPYYVTASLAKSEDHIATYIGITFLTLLTLGLKKNAVCKIFLICIGILLSMTYIFMQLAANNIGFTRYSYTIYNRMVAFQNEKAKTRLFPLLIAVILTFKQKKLISHPITKETSLPVMTPFCTNVDKRKPKGDFFAIKKAPIQPNTSKPMKSTTHHD